MKAFVFITLLACAFAEPDLYNAAHHSPGFAHYPGSGAVVPQDTLSVQAAKAQHHAAKANAYAYKGFFPYTQYAHQYQVPQVHYAAQQVVPQVVKYEAPKVEAVKVEAVKPVVHHQAIQYAVPQHTYAVPHQTYAVPTTYTHATYPHVYNHGIYKREAEADSDSDSDSDAYYYNNYYGAARYPGFYNYASNPYYGAYSRSFYGVPSYSNYYGNNYYGRYKREAEAEPEADADSQYLTYATQHYPTTFAHQTYAQHYPAVYTHQAAYHVPTTTYATARYATHYPHVYNQGVYNYQSYYPTTAYHTIAKRDAEAESEPQWGYYNNYYNGYGNRFYGSRYSNYYGRPNYYGWGNRYNGWY